MKNNIFTESVLSLALIGLLIVILNPFHQWMPDMAQMTVMGLLVGVFGLFSAFVVREGALDEREAEHRMLAGRVAFLTGTATLLIGILYQSYTGEIDGWLVLSLVAMVLAKMAAHFYSDRNF